MVTRLQKTRNDGIRQALGTGSQTTLLDNPPMVLTCRAKKSVGCIVSSRVGRVTVDRIPHNALHVRFKGKRNKCRSRLRWINNINEDIEPNGLTLRDMVAHWLRRLLST